MWLSHKLQGQACIFIHNQNCLSVLVSPAGSLLGRRLRVPPPIDVGGIFLARGATDCSKQHSSLTSVWSSRRQIGPKCLVSLITYSYDIYWVPTKCRALCGC